MQGQAPHLHDAVATADPVLRAAQTKELLSAPLTDARTAYMEPTTARRNRHPWAGFDRPIAVAGLHIHPQSLADDLLPVLGFNPAWAIYSTKHPVYTANTSSSRVPVLPFSTPDPGLQLFMRNPSPDVLLVSINRTEKNDRFVRTKPSPTTHHATGYISNLRFGTLHGSRADALTMIPEQRAAICGVTSSDVFCKNHCRKSPPPPGPPPLRL